MTNTDYSLIEDALSSYESETPIADALVQRAGELRAKAACSSTGRFRLKARARRMLNVADELRGVEL